jgi:HEPN domain-containing protein
MTALTNNLLKIAIKDIEVSELLHSKKYYSQSYFYFQQATEKANKSFGLLAGIITEDECLDFKHDQFKIFRKGLIGEKSKLEKHFKLFSRFPNLKPDPSVSQGKTKDYYNQVNNQISFIDSLRNRDLTDLCTSDLNYLLDSLSELYNFKFKFPPNFDGKMNEIFRSVIEWIETFPTLEAKQAKKEYEDLLRDPSKKKDFLKMVKILMKSMMDIFFIEKTFYYCAILTIQHSSRTRYPIKNVCENPLKVYSGNLPMIRKQTDFLNYLKLAILKLNKLEKTNKKLVLN